MAETLTEPAQETAPRRAFTARALLIGLSCVVGINLLAPYSEWIVHSTLMTTNYFPLGLALILILVVCILNPLLALVSRGFRLTRDELAVIYIMALAAVSVPTYGITGYVLSISASPFYFANPENGWGEFLHDSVPRWIVPGPGQPTAWFFEGLPPGAPLPWDIWVGPLFWWMTLIAATLTLSVSLIAIFRAQWAEKERLNFPLADIPVALIEGSDGEGLLPRVMRNRLLWYGFAVSFLKVMWDVPSYFNPQWPEIGTLRLRVAGSGSIPGINTVLTLPLVGITYFVNVDVIFSVWFFNLLNLAEVALFNRTGFTIGPSEVYSVTPAALAWQGFGAFAALVAGGVWVARGHLKDVFRKAWRNDPTVDDSREIMGYRAALTALLGSSVYILLWLNEAGISFPAALLLLYAVVTLYLGLTRIVIEGGLVFVRGPLLPQAFAMHMLGPGALSPSTMTGLAMSYAWTCDPIANFMPFGATGARLHGERGFRRGTYLSAIAIGLGVGLIVSFIFSLNMAYAHGGYNFGSWIFGRGGRVPFDTIVAKIQAGQGLVPGHFAFLGIGVLATIVLTYLRHRLPWWRLHPIGFSIASVGQVQWTMFTLFVTWIVKTTIIRVGGLMLFNRAKPFFIGLTLGHFTAAGISFLVDVIWFSGEGHSHYF